MMIRGHRILAYWYTQLRNAWRVDVGAIICIQKRNFGSVRSIAHLHF
jgi:hypothetical protein